jgi:hypothetical protein
MCAQYPAGTSCGSPTCSGNSLAPGATCNGSGTCKAGTASPCAGNFKCASGQACETVCTVASDCASAIYTCGNAAVGLGGQCLLVKGQPDPGPGDDCASGGAECGICL